MTASEIRQHFLDFFKSKGHTIVPSAPIIVKDDPTLMFINSGMAPFKDYFLGNKKAPYKRIADTQKCLRVSGKHNDLEEVGVDTYHHTLFEMLGNWSFGDYFKKDAIAWSWELLTEVYKINKDQIYVTVFEGDEKENLPFDQEAYDEWKKWISEDRILKGNKKDNFWEMGETGPCGPCSEIHIDCRSEAERASIPGHTLVNADHPQVIEIWNNVFMEFSRLKDGSLENLPAQHVDTGMGFERLVRVLQNKQSNYDTDIFTKTIETIASITHKTYDGSDSKTAIAFRVLSDHIRAISFTIADGQLPSSNGAGYVIRRILRRAVRYYYSALEHHQPLLFLLVPVIAKQFEHIFPELQKQLDFVTKVIREEEESFLRTLEKGLKKMDDIINHSAQGIINGKEAFELYDTYGFPIDLTRLIASEHKLRVDEQAFESEMQQQKNRSRAATAIDAGDWIVIKEIEKNVFVGYDDFNIQTNVSRYRKVKAKNKEQYQIVLEATPFYAESGGQVGDQGVLIFGEEVIDVIDTKKENDLIIHFTEHLPKDINKELTAKINWEHRIEIMYNHTATHLLHAALKEVLGMHVNQKGSLVNNELLRFDVSHFAKITDEELRKVSEIVNEKIRSNTPVVIKEMTKDEASKVGAMALFGEKYGDIVRVVIIDPKFSIELCGGTHVGSTGMIGSFVIKSESSVAAGVRRIEAITGSTATRYLMDKVQESKTLVELLKTKDPIKTIEKLIEDKTALEKKLESYEAKELAAIAKGLAEKSENINGIHFVGAIVNANSMDALKKIALDQKHYLDKYIVVLAATINNKASIVIAMDETTANEKELDAGKLIKNNVAALIKGGGGGQRLLATAGGQDNSQLNEVINNIKSLI
ncbi:MAG TPA: alanine--tRNA ligase [Edaphocola sp.]|nr:alanine--tRNA ligase [Edaphocola sp.]